jgi:ribonuclease P protein component
MKNGGHTARIGVIVPKKGNRLAVRRNRIKRLVRDHFRLVRLHLKSVDIIVHVTGAVTDEELMRILSQSLKSLTEEQAC